jgi:hypothetical protein
MIISFCEGCSGHWLGILLSFDDNFQTTAKFKQDADQINIKKSKIFTCFGEFDEDLIRHKRNYRNEKIIVSHSTNYNLLRQLWPDEIIYRIRPKTKIFKSIALCFLKKTEVHSTSVDKILHTINRYYQSHLDDNLEPMLPNTYTIDFGQLSNPLYIEQIFNITLSDNQLNFLKDYWELQQNVEPVSERDLKKFITKEELYSIFSKEISAYNLAIFIHIYESMNDLKEQSRLWTIDDISESLPLLDLLDIMKYK